MISSARASFFLSDRRLVAKLDSTLKLGDVDFDEYDAVHVPGGRGATFDLYPNEDVANALDHFWVKGQVVGTICHGAIALGNIPDHEGRNVRLRAPLFSWRMVGGGGS